MAELLGCRKCGASWSVPNNPPPGLLSSIWCNDCGGQSFIPIGVVYGVSRPPIHVGTSPPGPTPRPADPYERQRASESNCRQCRKALNRRTEKPSSL